MWPGVRQATEYAGRMIVVHRLTSWRKRARKGPKTPGSGRYNGWQPIPIASNRGSMMARLARNDRNFETEWPVVRISDAFDAMRPLGRNSEPQMRARALRVDFKKCSD